MAKRIVNVEYGKPCAWCATGAEHTHSVLAVTPAAVISMRDGAIKLPDLAVKAPQRRAQVIAVVGQRQVA